MNAQQIRKLYLDFFKKRGHTIIPRALLVPDNDPTTLFTGSGMQPLIPYLLGEQHPAGTRLVNSQTCLRAQDIEEVGDNRHTTFFEMLGNWSLGDYSKQDQIKWMYEFLTKVVGIDPHKIYITCFIGAPEYDIPRDTEAAELWQKLFEQNGIKADIADIGSEEDGYKRGIKPGERIFYYDGSKNWWNRGKTGPQTTAIGDPCGPDSEMFFDFGTKHDPAWGEHCHPNCDCGRFMEMGNNVFMSYRKVAEGKFELLDKPNIDHGSGLERIASAAIDSPDAFKIGILWPIIEKIEQLSNKQYDSQTNAMRVIADHLRAATFLAVDGVEPSNKEQGYVMRRLMRRAIRFAFELGIEQSFIEDVVPVIISLYEGDFPDVKSQKKAVLEVLTKEERVFRQTLRKGVKELEKMGSVGEISGEQLFKLYDTYGFPVELSLEEASLKDIAVRKDWKKQFDEMMQQQRQRSQTATKGQFKGGLGGQTLQHKKYHTATHLMYESLRRTLGDHVIQKGSNITEDRLRFDFTHPDKLTKEQIEQVEKMVNEQINNNLIVTFEEHPTKYALEQLKPLGHFGDRYGDVIKIYRMQAKDSTEPFSYEICGGPHVDHTSQLADDGKRFKIVKEEASSAGVRRIKAILQ